MMTLAERLADAERALHDLVTGAKPSVVVDQNGERVEYQHANLNALRSYIRDLRQQIAAESGSPVATGPARIFM